jgi:hypothetical protein
MYYKLTSRQTVPATAATSSVSGGSLGDTDEGDVENGATEVTTTAAGAGSDAAVSPYPTDAVVIVSTATVVPLPVTAPYGNGTHHASGKPTSSQVASTFITNTKPVPVPTGYPAYPTY